METFDIYQDIATRTGGDIYLGVVGLNSAKEKCPKCKGKGFEISEESFEVSIPEGIDDGNRIRISGRGNADKNGKRGDLYIAWSVS